MDVAIAVQSGTLLRALRALLKKKRKSYPPGEEVILFISKSFLLSIHSVHQVQPNGYQEERPLPTSRLCRLCACELYAARFQTKYKTNSRSPSAYSCVNVNHRFNFSCTEIPVSLFFFTLSLISLAGASYSP